MGNCLESAKEMARDGKDRVVETGSKAVRRTGEFLGHIFYHL